MENLVLTGLALIVIAWFFQLSSILKGNKEIQTSFVISYMLGVAVLTVDGFSSGPSGFLPAVLNALALVIAALTLFQVKVAKK
ncbi:MAG: hypothetical protein V1909_01350 [Candidatus Micrarchaeota archaeon]